MHGSSTTTLDEGIIEVAEKAAAELLCEYGSKVQGVDLVTSEDGPVLVVVVDSDLVDEFHRRHDSPDKTPALDSTAADVDAEAALLEDPVADRTAIELALELLGVDPEDAWFTGELVVVLGSEYWTEPEELGTMPPAVQASVDTRLSFHYPSGQFLEPVE